MMRTLVALAVGYVIGARAGSKDLDQVVESFKAVTATTEFADAVTAVRSHVGHTLRELASVVDGGVPEPNNEAGDLVERVKLIVERE